MALVLADVRPSTQTNRPQFTASRFSGHITAIFSWCILVHILAVPCIMLLCLTYINVLCTYFLLITINKTIFICFCVSDATNPFEHSQRNLWNFKGVRNPYHTITPMDRLAPSPKESHSNCWLPVTQSMHPLVLVQRSSFFLPRRRVKSLQESFLSSNPSPKRNVLNYVTTSVNVSTAAVIDRRVRPLH